jgi:hypothetical protein
MVKATGVPVHPSADGVIPIVAVIGEVVELVAVKAGMPVAFPLLEAAKPIPMRSFTHV